MADGEDAGRGGQPPPVKAPGIAGELLAWTWRTWTRHAGALVGSALLLGLPAELQPLWGRPAHGPSMFGLALLALALQILGTFSAAAAAVDGGLQALQGEAPRIGPTVLRGLRLTWRALTVFFLSMWLRVLAWLAALLLMMALVGPGLARLNPRWTWIAAALLSLATALGLAWFYPALPVALARPELGALAAVRRAASLTRGARARLLLVAILLQVPFSPLHVLSESARALPQGPDRTLRLLVYALGFTLASSFSSLAQVAAYRALDRERPGQGGALEGLGRVFE